MSIDIKLEEHMNAKQRFILDKFKIRDPKLRIRWDYNLRGPAVVNGTLSDIFSGIDIRKAEDGAREFLEENKFLFGLAEPKNDLNLLSKVSDSAGNISVALQQMHKGVPVHGGTIRVQFAANKTINRVTNKYQPDIDINTKPGIKSLKAVENAIKDAKGGELDKAFPPKLEIFKNEDQWKLAWVFRIIKIENKKLQIVRYFINANDGSVIFKYNDLQSFPDTTGQGTGFYSGAGNINTFQEGTTYKLIDNSRVSSGGPSIRVCDCDSVIQNPSDSIVSQDANNNWNNTTTSPRKDNQGPEVDALRYLGEVVDYYKNTHNWNSFNNLAGTVYAGVHYGLNVNNGYWIGTGIIFGDGDGNLLDYTTTKDFVAHEFTHGVTQYTAGLDYFNQAGGLNESFSDVFAIMVDRDDFDIFEQCTTPNVPGDAGRTMWDPSSGQAVWPQPNHFLASLDTQSTGYFDGQDPHYSSGYVNFACYLMVHGGTHPNSGISVNPIGHEKSEKIFFHALSIGLLGNNDATFLECREAALNAVDSLYSIDPDYLSILDSVKNAFTAVGIGPDIYIRDSLTDTGVIPSIGTLYLSPDIITRMETIAVPQTELGDMSNANLSDDVELGQTNYVYVRLQNRGSVTGDVTVKVYWTDPSSFSNPTTWHLIGSANATNVQPGTMKVTGPIEWPSSQLPPIGHFCLVGELDDPIDPAPDKNLITTGEMYVKFISQSNNFAWKNINVIDAIPGGIIDLDFMLRSPQIQEKGDLLIDLSTLQKDTKIKMRILKRLCENIEVVGLRFEKASSRYNYYSLTPGIVNCLNKIPFISNDSSEVHLYVEFPEGTKNDYQIQCSQRFGSQITSRMNYVINLLTAGVFEFIGNNNSKEVHKKGCKWISKMSKSNVVGLHSLEYAHMLGYDNCNFCLGGSKR